MYFFHEKCSPIVYFSEEASIFVHCFRISKEVCKDWGEKEKRKRRDVVWKTYEVITNTQVQQKIAILVRSSSNSALCEESTTAPLRVLYFYFCA